MTQVKSFTVEEHRGDVSIINNYAIGRDGVVQMEVMMKDGEYVVILMKEVITHVH